MSIEPQSCRSSCTIVGPEDSGFITAGSGMAGRGSVALGVYGGGGRGRFMDSGCEETGTIGSGTSGSEEVWASRSSDVALAFERRWCM